MTTTTKNRTPFPTSLDGPGCPACGAQGTVQAVEYGRKMWNLIEVETGVVKFEGHFEWSEDSVDEHIYCMMCQSEWAMPERVDFL